MERVKWGDLHGASDEELLSMWRSPRAGVRAPIGATKPGNAGGAKGCRKVET
jgi:hypothetical protein